MQNWKPILPPFREHKSVVFGNSSKVSSFIYQIGESEILRKPSRQIPVNKITSTEVQEKFAYLKKCLIKYRKLTRNGRGITAVQVGIPERFSVVYIPDNPNSHMSNGNVDFKNLFIIVNPKINSTSKRELIYPEMCMSANPIIAPTIRPAWIEFDYYDEGGKLRHWDKKDDTEQGRILNRVFQHEIDHMNGVINIDKCNPKDLILESDPKFYKNADFTEVST